MAKIAAMAILNFSRLNLIFTLCLRLQHLNAIDPDVAIQCRLAAIKPLISTLTSTDDQDTKA
jgi:hypothetical protein